MALSDYFHNGVYKDFFKAQKAIQVAGMSVYFSTLDYKGQKLIGDCNEWNSFTSASLSLPSEDLYFSKITAFFATQDVVTGHLTNNTLSCADPKFMNGFAASLHTGDGYKGTCIDSRGVHEYRVYLCRGSVVMCTDCHFSCGESTVRGGESYY